MGCRKRNILVAVTGASGSVYAKLTLGMLLASDEVERIGLIISRHGGEVANWEKISFPGDARIIRFDNGDMFASPASGSSRWDSMAVVPCSMGCVGRIASGAGGDLIARAADVMLKEKRRLLLVPRETPLNLIHLRNLTALAEAGATILPASPSFYSHPQSAEEVCTTVTERIVSCLGIPHGGYVWGE